MKSTERNIISWFLRIALSLGFLSAVADRFGYWPEKFSAWGNWPAFLAYTEKLNPWIPRGWVNGIGVLATSLEIILGIGLLIGYKLRLVALASGILLFLFGAAMTFAISIKSAFDASVFAAAAASFALAFIYKKNDDCLKQQ